MLALCGMRLRNAKILWVQKNEPDVFSSIDKILLPKDFIRYKLSGEFFSDVSDASGMSLLNVGNREWSSDILDVLGWKREWLPEVTESTEVSAKLSSTAANLTGLPAGIPIVAGGGDCAAQAVGSSIVEEGKVSVTLGTSGVVFAQSDEYRVEPQGKLHSFCHAVPGKWHMMGVMLSAAGSFQWFKNKFGAEESRIEEAGGLNAYDNLTNQAAEAEPGSEGCVFLPYLSGERTPHPDPHARGAFIGLSLRHGMGHMARAVLEGVSFGLNDSLSLMRNLGINPSNVILTGGGTRSPLWKQMLADVFHSNCSMVNAKEGAAYGAALLASVGIGCHDSVENASRNWIEETENIQPGEEAKIYQKLYPFYQDLYPVLKDHFQSMAEVLERILKVKWLKILTSPPNYLVNIYCFITENPMRFCPGHKGLCMLLSFLEERLKHSLTKFRFEGILRHLMWVVQWVLPLSYWLNISIMY